MYASKTLEQRNNDAEPFSNGIHRSRLDQRIASPGWGGRDGRPEYQHGGLEANPVLVAVRQYIGVRRGNVAAALLALNNGTLSWGANAAQQTHAHRVLTLWLAVFT